MTIRAALGDPLCLRLSVCGLAFLMGCASTRAAEEPAHSAELDAAIIKQAQRNGVPEKLVRRIVMRESKYNARARNHSFWGLMQISYPTAKSMGFKGTPEDLLNPFVNLTYAVPYLANAFVIAGKQEDAAVRLYASGYYFTARQRGLLSMLRTAETAPVSGAVDAPIAIAAAPSPNYGVFGALSEPAPQPQPAPPIVQASLEPQRAVQASPNPAEAAQGQTDHMASTKGGIESTDAPIDMVADKTGALHPPKKWLHDGGVSTVARGEQRIDQVAAFEKADLKEGGRQRVAHSHKNTTFAAIDPAPVGAQAYAATVGGQDPQIANTDSQAAISAMTTSQGDVQPSNAVDPNAPQAATSAQEADEKPLKGNRKTRSAHKGHVETANRTKPKKSLETVAAQPSDDGQLRKTAQ